MYQRKQQRLVTIHERLGYLSYSRLKLMANAGLIHCKLASVDNALVVPSERPIKNPGVTKPWHRKGFQNRKKIHKATCAGDAVSVAPWHTYNYALCWSNGLC